MKKYILQLLVIVTFLTTYSAIAYQVKIPLENRSNEALQAGFQQGAQKLILHLTANSQAIKTLATDLQEASNWVDEYTTEKNSDNPDYPWLLKTTYSKHAIEQVLRKNHLPSWKTTPTPVYLLLKTTNNEPLPNDEPRWQALHQAASARGYHFNRLEKAPSEGSSDFLIAVVSNNTIDWSWYRDKQWRQWQQPADEQWPTQAADSIGQTLVQAQQQAYELTPIHLQINNVCNLSDYNDVIQALKKIRGIQNLSDDGIQGNRLSLTLISNHSISDIKQALDHTQELSQEQLDERNSSDADLTYVWKKTSTH